MGQLRSATSKELKKTLKKIKKALTMPNKKARVVSVKNNMKGETKWKTNRKRSRKL